jgi:hypothetical protein
VFRRGHVWTMYGIFIGFLARNYVQIFFGRHAAEINRCIQDRPRDLGIILVVQFLLNIKKHHKSPKKKFYTK